METPRNIIVSTILDKHYADWFPKWFDIMSNAGLNSKNLVVMALDNESSRSVEHVSPNIEVWHAQLRDGDVWEHIGVVKTRFISDVANKFGPQIFVEQDVLVFKSLFDAIPTHSDISTMYWNNDRIKNNQANVGFAFFNATPVVKQFLANWTQLTSRGAWDQGAFNRLVSHVDAEHSVQDAFNNLDYQKLRVRGEGCWDKDRFCFETCFTRMARDVYRFGSLQQALKRPSNELVACHLVVQFHGDVPSFKKYVFESLGYSYNRINATSSTKYITLDAPKQSQLPWERDSNLKQQLQLLLATALATGRVPILPAITNRLGTYPVWAHISVRHLLSNFPQHAQPSFLFDNNIDRSWVDCRGNASYQECVEQIHANNNKVVNVSVGLDMLSPTKVDDIILPHREQIVRSVKVCYPKQGSFSYCK